MKQQLIDILTLPAERLSTAQVMRHVLYALIPGSLLMLTMFGWGFVSNFMLGIGFAVGLEALFLKLRQRPLAFYLNDYSAVLTGWLLAIALPAYAPWWLMLVACIFAIIVAKQLYGGLGQNPFNPAMIGYAAVLVSYPLQMTAWPEPFAASFWQVDLAQAWQQIMGGGNPATVWDAYTSATVLDSTKVDLRLHESLSEIYSKPLFGLMGGQAWEWLSVLWLVGGVWLIYKRIISWHIPTALLTSLSVFATVFWLYDMQHYPSPLFHLFSGATMLGAFFIATDPVTASTTPRGKLLYAAGIGALIYIIRTWGGYPDAVAFSVILMNMVVPLIDQYTQPRVYGTRG